MGITNTARGPLPSHIAGQFILAALVGGLIGFPLAKHGQTVGLRMTIGVALSACGLTLLAQHSELIIRVAWETGEIAPYIAIGAGVLGALVIARSEHWEHSLLTAAGVWLTAALGMAVGAGQEVLAVVTALFGMLVLVLPQLRA